MPLIETEGIVLKCHDLAEADRVVVVLTPDNGIVRAVAKGVKRLKSRYGSSLELFNHVRLTYFQKEERELVSLQECELLRSNFQVAAEPQILHLYSYLADLLLALVPPNDPNALVFRMTRACMASGVLNEHEISLIKAYFEIWLLRLSGYLTDWRKCYKCEREFYPDERPAIEAGIHFVCSTCPKRSLAELAPDGWYKIFHNVERLPPMDILAIGDELRASKEVSKLLVPVIERALDRSVTTLRSAEIGDLVR